MTTVMQLWIVCLILFHHVVVSTQQVADSKQYVIRDKRQAAFAQQLAEYEIVVPERVTYSGDFVSHDLHPANGGLQRRSKRSPADDVHFRVRVGDDDLHLELRPNSGLVAPAGVVERRSGHLANATTARIKTLRDAECHFHGVVRNHTESLVAVSACNGLRGMLKTSNGEYFIEPVKDHGLKSGHPHLLYKRSALPIKEKEHTDGTCGTKENFRRAIRKRNRWERKQNGRTAKGQGRRQRRSVSTEKNVETLVVADKMMMDYYSNEDIETYILTVMNMVSALYRDASIGNAINVVLVRMVLLENEESEKQEDLSISHHADNTLKSFCKWQKFINPKDEGHPNHHDVAILLTRYNICTRMNEPCSTLGLAEVAGMCQPHRSCNINEDTGLALAYTIAHEMGHNFGMNHDGPHNGCQAPYGERQHVMSPHLNSDTSPLVWSNCSRQEITKFLDRDWGSCLDDEPSEHEFHFPQLPPGAMYDADHQCRLQYGPDASYCHGIEDVCLTLWCRLENKCVTRLEPAAPGTQCGKHKWCFMGQCTLMGERPEAIDGEWGQWSEWTQCSRTCGAGISLAVRHCDNPAPANGGRYCIGERKRYRVCNTEPCAEGAASFRSVQCAKHNTIPYKEEQHNWTPVSTPLTPCQLHCKPEGKFFSVMLEDSVIDGTPCNPGTRDLCINGKCRRVSCDWGIDSNAQEDRCGICHGDGTQCQTIRGEFTQEEGVGYVEAIQVPKWSRNIRVEELEEANNYIAVKEGGESDGEYYLNGNWFIQWSGEFRAAGSTIYYRREGEKETIHIPGPIKEDLHIMLLYQTTNPGLKFEYTVPNANITRKPEFHWEYTDWTVCTTTCGGGTQVSSARCMEKEAGLVEDKYCNSTDKPPDVTRVCNKHQCPARWWAGPWQHCSITCGNKGVRRRTVICIRSFGADEQIALLDQDCDGQRKPNEVEPCQHRQPCPGDIYWQTGPWSDTCRGDPCNNQTRKVWCSLEGGPCDDQPKPSILRQCGNISCGVWTAGPWSECSQSCGEGVQFRRVMCEGGLKCLDANEPESIRICNRSCHQHPYHPHNHHSSTDESNGAPSWHTTEATHTLLEPVENLHEDNSVTLRTVTETRVVATDPADQEGSGHPDAVPSRAIEGSTDKENRDGDRSKDVVEDKINPDDFQVIEIGNQPSPKDRYEVLSDQWFKEGVDIMDYKSSVANTQKNEYQSDSMPSSDHEEENAIGTDYVKKYKVQMKPHFEWRIGEWNQCSRPCDGGHRSREILCFEMTTQTLVDSDLCDPHARPLYMETCNLDACQEWELSDWSQCSATCDEGIKTRSVKCPQPSKCNLETKPKEQMPCQVKACITWIAGPWSQCPVTCGGGYQVRHVKCVNHTSQEPATGCDLSHRPIHRQHCNLDECPQDQSAKFSTCHDKLETKLCQSLRHMCSTWYFKVKCCHTCNKRGSHKTSNNSYKRKSS